LSIRKMVLEIVAARRVLRGDGAEIRSASHRAAWPEVFY
jgi:hypothetical protein